LGVEFCQIKCWLLELRECTITEGFSIYYTYILYCTVCPNKSDNTKLLALVSANLHRIAHN